MQKSERITEHLVLSELGIDIQKDSNLFVQGVVPKGSKLEDALRLAGGKPKTESLNSVVVNHVGKAMPEFIYVFNEPELVLVVECKKNTKNHSSIDLNQPSLYAVDGALYYAKYLKTFFNVIVLAVSGTSIENLKVSTYEWRKNHDLPQEYAKGKDVILEISNYLKLYKGEQIARKYSLDEIRKTALIMHETLREVKITERNKPVFIAGILIALNDKPFETNYLSISDYDILMEMLMSSIRNVLRETDIQKDKIDSIVQAFNILKTNTKLRSINFNQKGSIRWYIELLDNQIKPMMMHAENTLDALGVFYHEFIKYSGGDGSGLGIILTPQHLTEFMVDLVNISKNDRVIDICCGTGSFLITAMTKMFSQANNQKEIEQIRTNGLYGIDTDPELYTLAIANMIIRKDGKSNIHYGDCFDSNLTKKMKSVSPTIGLINPPYSQKQDPELKYVLHLLNMLVPGGKAAVVVPMSCAIGTKYKELRERLFKSHTLRAVFSMPDDIFYPTGTNVCVMVWEAHKPHDPNSPTYFGYTKDDGFVKKKKLGRVDVSENGENWKKIKKQWIDDFKQFRVVDGYSAVKNVNHFDEWLCEAYMKTDYSNLTHLDFEQTIRSYVAYKVENNLVKDGD
jgi:type I restriction-modification system DNA methylase subunit